MIPYGGLITSEMYAPEWHTPGTGDIQVTLEQFIKEDGKDTGAAHYNVSTPEVVKPFHVERMEGGALKRLKVADLREFVGM